MEKQHPAQGPHLTNSQKTRIEFARKDLERARSEDLAGLDAAGLIILVERMRQRLRDVLDVVDEVDTD